MKYRIPLILLVGLLLAADKPRDKGAAADQKNLQGTWKVLESEEGGQKASKKALENLRLVIRGDRIIFRKGDMDQRSYSFTLDPAKKPPTIDVVRLDGRTKGKAGLGIYALDGDTLRICMDNLGKKRPEGFATGTNKGVSLMTLKREK